MFAVSVGNPVTVTTADTAHMLNCVMMKSTDAQWLPGSSVITWEDRACCSPTTAIYQALCMRRQYRSVYA